MDRSTDGGQTWLSATCASPLLAGLGQGIRGVGRANGMPVTRADRSNGPHSGRVYVNWTDNRIGEDDNDVWLVGDDQAAAGRAGRVNDDPPGAQQFLSRGWTSTT